MPPAFVRGDGDPERVADLVAGRGRRSGRVAPVIARALGALGVAALPLVGEGMSGVPVHSPASAVSVPPSAAGPETPGVAVFCGACAATAGGRGGRGGLGAAVVARR